MVARWLPSSAGYVIDDLLILHFWINFHALANLMQPYKQNNHLTTCYK